MKRFLLSCFLALLGIGLNAQITGTKIIGTDYTTLAAAFADLNAQGVGAGGATLNIPVGYSETAPAGGFLLGTATLNGTLSAANPLVIQKSGTGANPVFTAYTGTGTLDAYFKFVGVDYVTIDGITLQESSSNTTAVTLMERGFAFYNLSATDGCNNNTVQNCTVNFPPGAAVVNQTEGIYFTHTNAAGTEMTPTAESGTHSNNKIYGNTVNNPLSRGITFVGNRSAAPFALRDTDNDVGGSSAATGNTLNNVGDLGYVTANGVFGIAQQNMNVSNNIMIFADGGLGVQAIYIDADNSSATVNNNTITAPNRQLYYASTTDPNQQGTYSGIYCLNTAGAAAPFTVTANNNNINIGTPTIFNAVAIPPIRPILSAFAATPNTGAFTAIGNNVQGSAIGAFYGIYSTASGTLNINNNEVHGIATDGAVSASTAYGIWLGALGATTNITNNKIHDFQSMGATSAAHGIYVATGTAGATVNIVNNLIGDLRTPLSSVATPSISGIYLVPVTANTKYNVYYNSIYLNATSTGANFSTTGIFHTNSATATSGELDMRDNIIVNLSTPNGTGRATALRRSAAALANYASTSNNNDLSVGTATNSNIYFDGTTGYNFANFQTAVAPREAASENINPAFVSTVGANASFLTPKGGDVANQPLDNKGATITGITTDYTGATRNATTPDMGAYEFTYAPLAYCAAGATTTGAEKITNVTFAGFNNNSTSTAGYEDFTSITGNVTAGTAYPFSATQNGLGYSGDILKVWIDYNQDGDFADAGELALTNAGGGGLGPYIGNITIPATASGGITRMRVRLYDGGETTGDPCGTTPFYGQVEDYTLDITPGTAVGYCDAGGAITAFEVINNVTFAGINNNSTTTAGGYQDFTNVVGNAIQGNSYPFSAAENLGYSYADDQLLVWIDFNQDMDFDDAGEQVFSASGPSPWSGNIAIPATATQGPTRMRVRLHDTFSGGNATPCGYSTIGEVEDYTINIKLPPTINVTASAGTPTGAYATLKEAFDAVNDGTHQGNIDVVVFANTIETATAVLNASGTGSSNYTNVTVKPDASTTPTIGGSVASAPLIEIRGSNFTIDGSNNGTTSRDLTIQNTATTAPVVIRMSSTPTNRTDNITLKNATFIDGINQNTAILLADINPTLTGGNFKDVMIDNISVQNAFNGILAFGVFSPGVNGNITVKNSNFDTAGANAISGSAIAIQGVDGAVVDNNTIGNFASSLNQAMRGVWFANGTINASATNNTIFNLSSGVGSNNVGINVTGTATTAPNFNITITNNKITNIKNTSTTGYGAEGIVLSGNNTTGNITVYNNFISDVAAYGYTPAWGVTDNGYGIFVAPGTGYKIYNNTVNMATDQISAAGGNTAPITIATGVAAGAIDLRNNIFVTTQTKGTRYAIYSASPNTAYSNIDNNDYYSAGPNLGFIGGTARATLADIQTGFGGNTNSADILPVFTSATDLHLDATNIALNNLGTPLAEVTTDIDGETRNTTTPDMGADEFDATPPGCLNDPYGEYPHSIYTPVCNGVVGVIVPDGWAGEYSTVAVTAGTEYTFASSIATDFITISDDAGTTTLASGTGTVVWTATASANVRFYTHLDSNCTPDDQSLRARTVKCGTLTYCGPIVFDFNVEPITLVDFAGIHNETSPAINGTPDHEDFTTSVAPGNVNQGFPYQISVNGNADGGFENYYVVFADWNQNGVLNDAGEVYFGDGSLMLVGSDGVSNPPATGIITVPAGATLGNTLMRVKKVYSFGVPPVFPFTDPCEGDGYGQVEDYTITVGTPPTILPDCTGFGITYPQNQDVIAGGNVTLTWTAAANSIGYHVKVGTTFGGIEVFGGDVIGATSLTVTLDPETIYYLSVTPYNNMGNAACTEEILFQTDDSPIGCTNAPNGQYPGGVFVPACIGTPQAITTIGWPGEYSLVAVTAGTEYIFSSDISTDYITISDANGIVTLAAGTGSVTWTATATANVRFYTHLDASCNVDSSFRARMVQCGTPPPPPEDCEDFFALTNPVAVDNALFFGGATAQHIATDIPVGNTAFTVYGMEPTVAYPAGWPTPITFSFRFYDDGSGVPGTEFDTRTGIVTNFVYVYSEFGRDFYKYTVAFDTPINFNANTTYWIEVESTAEAWETEEVLMFGSDDAFYNTNTGGAWTNTGIDQFVFNLLCDDPLAVGEAGNSGLAYYPNPVKDVLNITSKQKVESVEIYSVAGQKVMTVSKVSDGKVNVSKLSQGVYVFRVKLENGQVETFKIIKD
ncbi:MAG: GEVED domain-containing protein [Flavobacteriaceae bacterium]|jgi:hypothetical protein|nr:GEVED domain-containing protein [Flavobacteriaceae bacterium]